MHIVQIKIKRLRYKVAIFFSVRECLTLSSLIFFLSLQIENINENQRFEVRNCNLFFFSRIIKIKFVWHLFFYRRIILFLIRECLTFNSLIFLFFLQIENISENQRFEVRNCNLFFSLRMIKIKFVWYLFFHYRIILFLIRANV